MNPDIALEGMLQVAQPLDEWCEFCTTRLGVMHTADGVAACESCAEAVLEAMAKYEADGAFLKSFQPVKRKPLAHRDKRRSALKRSRASRKKNRGRR